MANQETLILTGMSGAGRSTVAHALEDLGWYVVDNLPPALLPALVSKGTGPQGKELAVVVDVRGGEFFDELTHALAELKKSNSDFDDVIITPTVKAADVNADRTVTVEEMRTVYNKAELVTADMNFSINHSVVPANLAFECKDCHGRNGWVLDWEQLGYKNDPKGLKSGKDPKDNSKDKGKNK